MPTMMPLASVRNNMRHAVLAKPPTACNGKRRESAGNLVAASYSRARKAMSEKQKDESRDDGDKLAETRPKLVESKERWAREGRLLTGHASTRGERLPPGQHLVRDWPVLDLGVDPEI